MRVAIRPLKEEEIPKAVEFLTGQVDENSSPAEKDLVERQLTTQFHKQRDLLIGAFAGDGDKLVGMVSASGQGDTVSIDRVLVTGGPQGELTKKLITAVEKASRRYGYSRIFLSASESRRNFLVALGYKPKLCFSFSGKRREILSLLSGLYPMWIEVGGEQVKVLLGGDHLEPKIKQGLKKMPIITEFLFLKNL